MECSLCHRPKGDLTCELCSRAVCKKCTNRLPKETFVLLPQVPPELSHRLYCGACYDSHVAPALEGYERTVEQAKGVFVFHKGQGEETRLFYRSEKPFSVTGCGDREEAMMRLAFSAVRAGFNALVDVDIFSRKVRNEGYQTSAWQGTGVPTRVDAEKLERSSQR